MGIQNYLGNKNCVHFWIELEILQNPHPFRLGGLAKKEGFLHLLRVILQCEHIVREHNNLNNIKLKLFIPLKNLVISAFMEAD